MCGCRWHSNKYTNIFCLKFKCLVSLLKIYDCPNTIEVIRDEYFMELGVGGILGKFTLNKYYTHNMHAFEVMNNFCSLLVHISATVLKKTTPPPKKKINKMSLGTHTFFPCVESIWFRSDCLIRFQTLPLLKSIQLQQDWDLYFIYKLFISSIPCDVKSILHELSMETNWLD